MTRLSLAAILLPLALAACSSNDDGVQGYIEGTYVYIAAESAGRVVARPVIAGQRVAEGDVIFVLDDSDQSQAVAGAEARLAQARAELANIETGQRPEEIAVLAAELSAARTAFQTAQDDYLRKLTLLEKGVVARSVVDDAKAARDAAEAHAEAAERQLLVAKLPARPEQIAAAERNVAAQEAALAQARIQLERRRIRAPAAGLVEETYFEPGEQVPAGQAVISLLPDANRKVRFFVPEADLARITPGMPIGIGCDGCIDGLTAEVAFVSSSAEFTPPVIYSRDSREKLVFRIDARPIGDTVKLNVGQPVDVTLDVAPGGN